MCENVRGDLEALSFAMDEVRLFLDTHPTNTCALKAYQELHTQRDAAVKAYEAAVGRWIFTVQAEKAWNWVQGRGRETEA